MNKVFFFVLISIAIANSQKSFGQIDLKKIDLDKIDLNLIFGKVLRVEKGFSPKFYLNDVQIPSVNKVAEILGVKQIDDVNKLFKKYKTGRTIYRVTAYVGSAVAVYGVIRKIDASASKQDYQGAFATALTSVGTGVLIKMLTKGASYKAVDIFNKAAVRSIKDILSIGVSSDRRGAGLYVSL